MPQDCSAQALATAAQCFQGCIPDGMQDAVQTYLLAQMANMIAGTSTDPNTLAKLASCFRCLDGTHDSVQTFLLCQMVNK